MGITGLEAKLPGTVAACSRRLLPEVVRSLSQRYLALARMNYQKIDQSLVTRLPRLGNIVTKAFGKIHIPMQAKKVTSERNPSVRAEA